MAQHTPVKPEKLVNTAVGVLEEELVLPRLIRHEGVDAFRGARDDTITFRVPGLLPARERAFRADGEDRKITYDTFTDTTVTLTMGGYRYSAVQLQDEQVDFDLINWPDLMGRQARAVARSLNRDVSSLMQTSPFQVTIGDVEAAGGRAAINEARRVLNRFRVPQDGRVLVLGSDFEQVLLNDEKLTLALNTGDAQAEDALHRAVLGNIAGFTLVTDISIPADEAFAFVGSGFILNTAAPYVPNSVPFGATTSWEGFALRWLRDYDPEYTTDRSLVDTYVGHNYVKDYVAGYTVDNGSGSNVWKETISSQQYFVRGVKLSLNKADTVYPADTDELGILTGVTVDNDYPVAHPTA